MADDLKNGWGAQALDVEQQQRRYQNAVVSGCLVSDGSGALEVDVASGEAIVAGTQHQVSASTLTLQAADPDDPRKDVVYVDSSGTPAVATGTPAPARPDDEIRRDTYSPAPPDLSQTDACVLAEVWVGADVNDITSADISDRRLFADLTVGDLDADAINTAQQNTTFVFVGGQGGEYQTVNAAVADLAPSGGQRYRLVLLADTSEPAQTTWENGFDLDTNGYEMVLDSDDAEHTLSVPDGVTDAAFIGTGTLVRTGSPSGNAHVVVTQGNAAPLFDGLDIDNRVPSSAPDNKYFGVQTFDSSAPDLSSCDISGGDSGDFCHGVRTSDSSAPDLSSCDISGGDGGDSCQGVQTRGSSAPDISSCDIRGGDGGDSCRGVGTRDSSAPDISSCDIRGGDGGNGCHGVGTRDSSAPDISSCDIRGGDGGDFCRGVQTFDSSAPDISSCDIRGGDGASSEGLLGRSDADWRLLSCSVTGRGTNDAAQIGSSANTSKNYVIAGGSFVATDSTANAIVAPSADGQDDPIYNVAAVGDIINLTPTQ